LSSKASNVVLRAGEGVRMETSGGGGVGDPADRSPADVARDLADGVISPARARAVYGWQAD